MVKAEMRCGEYVRDPLSEAFPRGIKEQRHNITTNEDADIGIK